MMEITVTTKGTAQIFCPLGDIDGKTAPDVLEKVKAAAVAGGRVILDLSQTPYMSSAGLRVMLSIYRHVIGSKGKFVLTGMNDEIKDTMEMTGFLSQFTTADTVDDGLKLAD